MINRPNPFALARASDFSDQQINDLWVELGQLTIKSIIEPMSTHSKFILGGKGTGKTHLLRYYSYPAAKLRAKHGVGLNVILENKFLAVFLRATNMDAARFELSGAPDSKWQQLFGIYLELRLAESVLDALIDVVATSPEEHFNAIDFINALQVYLAGADLTNCSTLADLRQWILLRKRLIDDAVNNAAFTGELDIQIPFSLGSFCIPIAKIMGRLNSNLDRTPLIYLIDEIENFSESQQQVINTLIRYGEGLATFRVTGRLYSRKTYATLANGEQNREQVEFKTEILDDILRSYTKYPEFAKKFVKKRLLLAGVGGGVSRDNFSPTSCFYDLDPSDFYSKAIEDLGVIDGVKTSIKTFQESLKIFLKEPDSKHIIQEIMANLTDDLPPLIQKLNLVQFAKKINKKADPKSISISINKASQDFIKKEGNASGWYATAYGHYSADIFAQICRDSRKAIGVPYAGFEMFTRMSSGNPRNLLIILGRAFEIAQFREIDFLDGKPLSINYQTQAALAAARFTLESDTNYGKQSDFAREAVRRLAELLRAARFSLRIPEKSPLAISFSDSDLSQNARETLNSSLNYSLVYEVYYGRKERNTKVLNRKIQLNPILSPRWGLPVVRGGDIKLNKSQLDAIFSNIDSAQFDTLLKILSLRWNSLLRSAKDGKNQQVLFE
ncbi:hypothetical protein [Comamonas sp.]|uniref:ORC-CDC6 family AAA ATPase n=1 Tax=Comamonas sp. TaxID=34028 RepID=UPI00289AACD6|nr:hypothetical protein [Comamonas sp.]